MMFAATFTAYGQRQAVTWRDGRMEGDEFGTRLVVEHLRVWDGELLGPAGGPSSMTNHIAHPYSVASMLITDPVFEDVRFEERDVPPLPPEHIIET